MIKKLIGEHRKNFKSRLIKFTFSVYLGAKQNLQEIQKELDKPVHTLIQECPTRWNSTLLMLKRILEQKEVLALYSARHSCLSLSFDWKLVETLIHLLQPFYDATLEAEADSTSISIVIPISTLIKRFFSEKKDQFPGLSSTTAFIEKEISKRLGDVEK